MSTTAPSSLTKIGSVIYLGSATPIRSAAIVGEVRKSWPDLRVGNIREQHDSVFLQVGTSEIAICLCREKVPPEVTAEILSSQRRGCESEPLLARHQAYIAVSGLAVRGAELSFACDLTKAIVGILSTVESLAVCWLNGPVLHEASEFAGIAKEMLRAGVLPLLVWIGVRWDIQSRSLYTKGMLQFGSPEVMLAGQTGATPDKAEYLFEVANYVLTSDREISEGETIEGPGCTFKIESVRGSNPMKKMLILVPLKVS